MFNLNYNQLYYFYVVATHGSIKKACDKLNLTQPSISGGIKTLEESLGVKLFDREYRKLTLNRHGKIIYEKAQKIFSMGEQLLDDLSDQKEAFNKNLRIGASPTIPKSFFIEYLDFLNNEENYIIDIHLAYINELKEKIRGSQLDIVLTNEPVLDDDGYSNSILLHNYELLVLGSENYLNLKENFPHSTNNIPMLGYSEDSKIQREIDYYFYKNNIKPKIIGTTDDSYLRIEAAKKIDCLIILPRPYAEEAIKNHNMNIIGKIESLNFEIWATYKSEQSVVNNRFFSHKNVDPQISMNFF